MGQCAQRRWGQELCLQQFCLQDLCFQEFCFQGLRLHELQSQDATSVKPRSKTGADAD